MGQLEHFLKNPGSGLKILPYGRGRPGEGRRVGSMQTTADKGGRGESKIGKILRTSFMDGPLHISWKKQ